MKKIMFFMYSFPGGGAERTVLNIINNLNKTRFKPILVLGNDKEAPYLQNLTRHVKVINLNAKRARNCILPLKRVIVEEKPEILFSTINANNLILTIAKVLSFHKSKLIVREANNRTQSGNVSLINKILTTKAYNMIVDEVIALSYGVEEDLVTNFKIDKRKVTVIYNPIEIDKIRNLGDANISDFNFSKETKYIISVGRLVEQKNYPLLLNTIKILKNVNIQLLILGEGPLEDKLKKRTKNLGIEDKIHFLGFKKNPYKYIKKSDIFVLTSNWEGFGHVIVEAMSVGTPVIATNCKSGPSEIIGDDEYGILVPTNDTEKVSENITRILGDQKLSNDLISLGYKRAQDFMASKITKEYEKIFDI